MDLPYSRIKGGVCAARGFQGSAVTCGIKDPKSDRLDLTYEGASTSAAADLETLSGLKLGNSVVQLREIYPGFDITLVADPDLGRIFELRSGNTGNLLLWGPVTDSGSEGTDTIMGIYSVDASVGFC